MLEAARGLADVDGAVRVVVNNLVIAIIAVASSGCRRRRLGTGLFAARAVDGRGQSPRVAQLLAP